MGSDIRMLKATVEFIAPSVKELFNLSLKTGHVPHGWKRSTIVKLPPPLHQHATGQCRCSVC